MVEHKLSLENRPAKGKWQPALTTSRSISLLLVPIQQDKLGQKCATGRTTRLDINQWLSLEKINA